MKKEKMVTVTIKTSNGAERKVELSETQIVGIFGLDHGKVQLSTLKAGETFSTGKHEWVVLEQSGDTTAVLHKDVLEKLMQFDGSTNNWVTSYLRGWLNNTFAKEIMAEIGADNLVAHTPDLSTDDGSDSYAGDGNKDKVSLLSCNTYRKYHKYIPKTDSWYWTLTALSTEEGNTSYVRYVYSGGTLVCDSCRNYCGGVRPFCIFKSNILVSKGE